MSTKKWKNKELSNLMTEKFGFKMDLNKLNEQKEEQLEEAEELDEGSCSEGEMEEGSCGAHEGMDEGKEEECEKCEKAKSDCECPKEAMDEEKEDNVKMVKPDEVDGREVVVPDGPGELVGVKAEYKIKEHKIWNDKGFKMDLNKLLK